MLHCWKCSELFRASSSFHNYFDQILLTIDQKTYDNCHRGTLCLANSRVGRIHGEGYFSLPAAVVRSAGWVKDAFCVRENWLQRPRNSHGSVPLGLCHEVASISKPVERYRYVLPAVVVLLTNTGQSLCELPSSCGCLCLPPLITVMSLPAVKINCTVWVYVCVCVPIAACMSFILKQKFYSS